VRDVDYSLAPDFFESFFAGTEHAVELRVLGNDDVDVRPIVRFTRHPSVVIATCVRYDGIGRAIYFGVATRLNGSHSGRREDLAELTAVWTDIDYYKLGITLEEALSALQNCPLPPTVIVHSGGGLHAYWLFREPLDVRYAPEVGRGDAAKEEVEAVLRQLAGVFAGDTKACDITRILRLPGSHNTKTGEMRLARIVWTSGNRYDLIELQEWLDTQRPLIERPAPPAEPNDPSEPFDDPFAEFARRYGFKPPIDVEERLAAMTYMGDGDAGIHQTQLHVSASLVNQGMDDDEVVKILMEATQTAAGHYGATWNWRREEKNIRGMIESWRAKVEKRKAEAQRLAEEAVAECGAPTEPDGDLILVTVEEYERDLEELVTEFLADTLGKRPQ
jgi:hypothetical protein